MPVFHSPPTQLNPETRQTRSQTNAETVFQELPNNYRYSRNHPNMDDDFVDVESGMGMRTPSREESTDAAATMNSAARSPASQQTTYLLIRRTHKCLMHTPITTRTCITTDSMVNFPTGIHMDRFL